MTRYPPKRMVWAVVGAALAAALVIGAGLALTAWRVAWVPDPSGGFTAGTGMADDRRVTQSVRDFFRGKGASYIQGLTIESLQVTGEPGGRTLSLMIRSDGATSPEYWPADLEAETGVALAWLRVQVDYPSGSPDKVLVTVGRGLQSEGGAPRFHLGGPAPTTAP